MYKKFEIPEEAKRLFSSLDMLMISSVPYDDFISIKAYIISEEGYQLKITMTIEEPKISFLLHYDPLKLIFKLSPYRSKTFKDYQDAIEEITCALTRSRMIMELD
jgi:hypothetical protein